MKNSFRLDTIQQKEHWFRKAREENAWFLFYHDPFVQYCRLDDEGIL